MNYKKQTTTRSALDSRFRFVSRRRMTVWLLFVCVGLSHGVSEEEYGTTLRMPLSTKAYSIEFKPKDDSKLTVLWKRDDPSASTNDTRQQVIGSYYTVRNLTQRDSGRYIMRDKDQKALSTKTVEVRENKQFYTLNPGEKLSFTSELEPDSCNIYFFPKTDHEQRNFKTEIVRQGRLQGGLDKLDCTGFELLKPCGILNEALQMSCNGRIEVRDQNDNKALVVEVEMEQIHKDPLYTAIGFGASVATLIWCCCMKCCCCGKRSSDKNSSEIAEPAVNFHECNEPAGPRQYQLRQPLVTHNSAVPSYTQSDPLVHNHPTVNSPSAVVSAPAEKADVPHSTGDEPRFELKGMTFPSSFPLSSDSTYCEVYTSDKLNFK